MRGREWADQIKERMSQSKKAVVVGGGYIGIEAAEAFAKAGIDTTIVDITDCILNTYLDEEFTNILKKMLNNMVYNLKAEKQFNLYKVTTMVMSLQL